MTYILQSDNEYLQAFREELPLSQASKERVQRSDFLFLREAVLAHYEIDPFSKKLIEDERIKDFNFTMFAEKADDKNLVELFRRSLLAREVFCLEIKHLDEPIKRSVYARWAVEKGLPLPECLYAEISAWELPILKTIKDVKKIDAEKLPPPVVAALGAVVISEVKKRANKASGKPTKVTDAIKSKLMELFMKDCALAEGEAPRKEDTIREYIELQFK